MMVYFPTSTKQCSSYS